MKIHIEGILTFISEQADSYATRIERLSTQHKATLAQKDKELYEAITLHRELIIKHGKLLEEYEGLKTEIKVLKETDKDASIERSLG